MPGKDIFRWGEDNVEVCARVSESRSKFKVLLKTRNEVFFLERWLSYYLEVLGDEAQIIILDNMSTEPEIFDIYKRYSNNLVVIQYSGKVDSAHSPQRFGDLYRAVWDSCDWYALFDTDEFLCLYDGQGFIRDGRIIECLDKFAGANFFPTLFLADCPMRDDAFIFYPKRLPSYRFTGKPILSSAMMRRQEPFPAGHNMDLPLRLYRDTPLCFVLLHMVNLSPQQRLRANMQKLVNFGIIGDENDIDTVLHADINEIKNTLLRGYVREIRLFSDAGAMEKRIKESLAGEHIEIAPDGKLSFFPEGLRELFNKHVNNTRDVFAPFDISFAPDTDENARIEVPLRSQGLW